MNEALAFAESVVFEAGIATFKQLVTVAAMIGVVRVLTIAFRPLIIAAVLEVRRIINLIRTGREE